MLVVLLTFICSALVGAIIGLLSKNEKMAEKIAFPLALAIALFAKYRNGVPAFPLEEIRPHITWLYTERFNFMMLEIHTGDFITGIFIMLGNIAVLAVVFAVLFKIKGVKSSAK
jgi:hypothetical protein